MEKPLRFVVVLLVLLVVCLTGLWLVWPRCVQVTVTNLGPELLSNAVVHVTGNSHCIGDLKVGESRTIAVRPTSASHVEVEFADPAGQRSRINAGGYIEASNYRGTIDIDLESGAIRRNEHRVYLSLY